VPGQRDQVLGVSIMCRLPVGVQVYGLRDLLENTPGNFLSVMERIKAMGYDGVELAGLYGLQPAYVHDVLHELGLTPIGAHVPLEDMMADLGKVIEDYQTVGVEYLAIPYLSEEYRPQGPRYAEVLAEMDRISEELQKSGLKLMYHNHDFEFAQLPDGTLALDDMFSRFEADRLLVQLDICWAHVAGIDPAAFIRKYGPRCAVVHVKDYVKTDDPKQLYQRIGKEEEVEPGGAVFFEDRPVGFGQILWEPILQAILEAGTKWIIIEQDEHHGLGSLEGARRSREYLEILGW
jgi:sugar phosphate isomerase/epimerase